MWKGYENALSAYLAACIAEWIRRGYKNTMAMPTMIESYVLPPWFGQLDFHASHRSNLLRKDPIFYNKLGWNEAPDLPYVWPNP